MAFKNLESLQKRLAKKLQAKPLANAQSAVTRATMVVRNSAVESIVRGGKSGVIYEKYNPRRTHQASKAGEAPASDTGFLVSQITQNVKSNPNGSVVGQIISAAPYSKYLEFGTTDMQPRPYMQPALNRNRKKIVDIFKQEGIIK